MPRACPEPALSNVEGRSRRGGKRPGAGAPKGNLNALKHGRHSTQLQQLAVTLALLPAVRDTFIKVGRRQRRQRRAAAVAGHLLLTQLLRACLAGLQDNQPDCAVRQPGHASKSQNSPDNNQKPNLTPEVNQTSVDRYRKAAPRRVGERPCLVSSVSAQGSGDHRGSPLPLTRDPRR